MSVDPLVYLAHYGYLAGTISEKAVAFWDSLTHISAAVTKFQIAAGLPPTGKLDTATEAKMGQRRCGCLDVRRSVLDAKWRKRDLTYFVRDYVGGLSKGDVDDLIGLAWADWMAVADIRLTRVMDITGVDIIVSTGRGRADGFDGPSGTLAWAYLASGADDQLLCRFDLDETWLKDNPSGGILFRNVACHEFGHLLGLEHSTVSSALMAPFYNPAVVSPRATDDIPRIQAYYGPSTTPPAPGPGNVPPNMVRLSRAVKAGTDGPFTFGSDMMAGEYLLLLGGDGPPPNVP